MNLSGTVERAGAIRRRFRIDSLAPQFAACEEMLRGSRVLDVAVLGQFKAGKSSFLNGLIGAAVVPVDVLPSTAVVTRIGYGPRELVTVHGLAGEPFEVPLARLAEFVTERGTPRTKNGWPSWTWSSRPSLRTRGSGSSTRRAGLRLRPQHAGFEGVDAPRRGGPRRVSVNHPLSEDDLLLLTTCRCTPPRRSSC